MDTIIPLEEMLSSRDGNEDYPITITQLEDESYAARFDDWWGKGVNIMGALVALAAAYSGAFEDKEG